MWIPLLLSVGHLQLGLEPELIGGYLVGEAGWSPTEAISLVVDGRVGGGLLFALDESISQRSAAAGVRFVSASGFWAQVGLRLRAYDLTHGGRDMEDDDVEIQGVDLGPDLALGFTAGHLTLELVGLTFSAVTLDRTIDAEAGSSSTAEAFAEDRRDARRSADWDLRCLTLSVGVEL